MSEIENPPAFPREDYQADDAPGQRGMSLRDWFAGQALSGWLASFGPGAHPTDESELAAYAFVITDAMLAARQAGQS